MILKLVVDTYVTRYLWKSSRFFKFLKLQKRKNVTAIYEKLSNFQKSLYNKRGPVSHA